MEKINTARLKDGSTLEIVRQIFPLKSGETCPEWLLPLFLQDLSERWHLYYHEAAAGKHPLCRDYLYAGLVNGVPCSRMWFGFSVKNGCGNFGNVATLPEYRRRGIMRELLYCCALDFYASGALFCSCDAAAAAAPAYEAAGFKRIVAPDKAPMAILRRGIKDFSEILSLAYGGETSGVVIRPGNYADRFDCDKLLAYAPEMYGQTTKDAEYPDYLSLLLPMSRNEAEIKVLETASGFCAGYCCHLKDCTIIKLHPAFEAYRSELSGK